MSCARTLILEMDPFLHLAHLFLVDLLRSFLGRLALAGLGVLLATMLEERGGVP